MQIKYFKISGVLSILLSATIVFAQTPFGSPTSASITSLQSGSTANLQSGGTISSGGRTGSTSTAPSGGAVNSGGRVGSASSTQSGGRVSTGGTVITGGSQASGGAVEAGGGSGSGGFIRTFFRIFTGSFIPRAGGRISRTGGTITAPNQPSIPTATQTINPTVQQGGSAFTNFNTNVNQPKDLREFISLIIDLIRIVIPLTIVMSLWFFFWGLTRFIKNSGDEGKIAEGKELMIWGTIALFVMVSVYGILNLLYASVFGVSTPGLPLLPTN